VLVTAELIASAWAVGCEEPCPQLHSPRMPPPPMPPLAADQIQIIVTWIQEGAVDD
jgi:hypothetical protein